MARRGFVVLLVSGLFLGAVGADDWPQWLGPQRDAIWRESGILKTFPADGPKVLWRTPVGGGYTGPAVAMGRVFLMDRLLAEGAKNHDEKVIPQRPKNSIAGKERVLCFDQKTGKELWKHEYDCPYTVSYPVGPRCTPIVEDGKVYTLGTEGDLRCLDAASGKLLWSKDFKKDYQATTPIWGHSAHPLIIGQKIICMVGGPQATVVAFHKDTGEELWKALSAKNVGYCPPILIQAGGQPQVIVWHGEAAASLNPDNGQVHWSHPLPTYQAMSISMPRFFEDKLFFTAYPQTALVVQLAKDQPQMEVVWKGDRKKGLYSVFSTPFVENGHIYGNSAEGRLVCIKADTGEKLWESLKPNHDKRLPSADLFIVKNGDRFFLQNEFGELIIAKLSPQGYEEISRAKLMQPTSTAWGRDVVWSHPAFADRCIFTRNDQELICVSLAEQ